MREIILENGTVIESNAEIEREYDELIEQLTSYNPVADTARIRRAFEFAYAMHRDQVRKSGEPYIIHPIGVAILVAQLKLDESCICAALLHDVVEDTSAGLQELEMRFGGEVGRLVDGLTKLSKYQFNSSIERQAANFRKMLIAMSNDLRVILIKLADRVHNMRTLEHMVADKQNRIAQETLDIFVPLANRLGIDWMKTELENLSFKYLHPEEYADLKAKVDKMQEDRKEYIQRVIDLLNNGLLKEHIKGFQIKGRFKHIYSIYRKLKRSGAVFEKLHDIIAFRIIVESKTDCYHALGMVHSMWTMVEGRFKDYISIPKPNKYMSLHTSVIGPQEVQFEVQIRTHEMDRVAEEGIAAHWNYKEGNIVPESEKRHYEWLRRLMEWQQEYEDPSEFLNTVKGDLFSDEVYVFTPAGEIRNLPSGSTPIDFAYAVHSEVGNRCAGAIVNGQIVPLRYQLKTGDKVDIITKPNQRPKSDWLQMVMTARARNRINRYLNQEEKEFNKQIGTQMLEKALKKAKIPQDAVEKLPEPAKLYAQLKVSTFEQLLIALGSEKISGELLVEKLTPLLPQAPAPTPVSNFALAQSLEEKRDQKIVEKHQKRSQSNVCVGGMDNISVYFAKCCSPVPGEPIVGFVTRGRGLAIHHISCQRVAMLDRERHVECHWDPKAISGDSVARSVNLKVIASDRLGMLVDVMNVINEMKINISQTHCRTSDNGTAIFALEVQIRDIRQLNQLLRSVEKVKGVIKAERVSS